VQAAILVLAALLFAAPTRAQEYPPDAARVDAAIRAAFPTARRDWQSRLVGDRTMKECSEQRNAPPAPLAKIIREREAARIQYPPDGQFLGDWKKGEALAQSGYGLRFTDYPPRGATGANCYACHQLARDEISYGTVGPSLLSYGKKHKFAAADGKAAYEKIFDSHAALPCSVMPRFGTNGVLTIEQIKDLTALLMSPDSPVNK
jgi:sulfur-oxidizing protein SoxX